MPKVSAAQINLSPQFHTPIPQPPRPHPRHGYSPNVHVIQSVAPCPKCACSLHRSPALPRPVFIKIELKHDGILASLASDSILSASVHFCLLTERETPSLGARHSARPIPPCSGAVGLWKTGGHRAVGQHGQFAVGVKKKKVGEGWWVEGGSL